MPTLLSNIEIESIVKVRENGVLTDFYVCKHNYPDLDNGRTLLLRRYVFNSTAFDRNNKNTYSGSTIDNYLTDTYFNLLSADAQAQITAVGIKTCLGGTSTIETIFKKVFLLSTKELGDLYPTVNDGTNLGLTSATLQGRLATGGNVVSYWTRTPVTYNTYEEHVSTNGSNFSSFNATNIYYTRPAFTVPSSTIVNDDGELIFNSAPSAPTTINVPENILGGSTITISWSASTDPDDNLAGYYLEANINEDTDWIRIYTGTANQTTYLVDNSVDEIAFRVRAYDLYGATSDYTTSSLRTVVHNVPPTAPTSISVTNVIVGGNLTVTWDAATDSDGTIASYTLERRVNESDYEQVYNGSLLTFSEQVLSSWATISYRVKATDNDGADSEYTESSTTIVQSGVLYIVGPTNDMGVQDKSFTFAFTPKVTGEVEPYLLNILVTLNGTTVFSTETGYTNTEYSMDIDVRTGKAGEHVIVVEVSSNNFQPVTEQYTYSIDDIAFPSGGIVVTLQDNNATPIFPQTLAKCILTDHGEVLTDVIKDIQTSVAGGFIEMETNIAVNDRAANSLYSLIVVDFESD